MDFIRAFLVPELERTPPPQIYTTESVLVATESPDSHCKYEMKYLYLVNLASFLSKTKHPTML